jgi:hypothetical protein
MSNRLSKQVNDRIFILQGEIVKQISTGVKQNMPTLQGIKFYLPKNI